MPQQFLRFTQDQILAEQLEELREISTDVSRLPELVGGKVPITSLTPAYTGWITIKEYNNSLGDASNSPPPDNEFVSINDLQDISLVEILPENMIATGAPVIINFCLWLQRNSIKSLLTVVGLSIGDNKASVISGEGFLSAGSIFVDIKDQVSSNCKLAVRTLLEPSYTTINWSASDGAFFCPNPGYSLTDTEINVASMGIWTIPLGMSAYVVSVDWANNAVQLSNPIPRNVPLQALFNANILPSNVIPPLGISGKIFATEIDILSSTFRLRESEIDFRLLKNRRIRFRNAPGSTFFQLAGAAASSATTYSIVTCTGDVGDQVITISSDADRTTPLSVTSIGSGIFYCFLIDALNGLSLNNDSNLLLDNQIIDFKRDYENVAVSITTGTASVITSANSYSNLVPVPVTLGGAGMPGLGQIGWTYYTVPGSVTATNFKVSLLPGGPPVAFTSAGTAVRFNDIPATVSAGTPSSVSLFNHFLANLQPVTLSGSPKPGASYTYNDLYLISNGLTSYSFQLSQLPNQAPSVFESGSGGASVALSAAITGVGYFPLVPVSFYARTLSDTLIEIANTPGGNAITPISSSGTFNALTVEVPRLSGNLKVRAILE